MVLVEVQRVTKEYRKGDQKIAPLKDVSLTVDRCKILIPICRK